MSNNLKIIAVIPARGGSKSIPKKNIKDFCGKPLIAHTIELAQKSKMIDRVIVSSDNHEIIEIALEYGAEAPFIRPISLSQDDTVDLPVFQHCLNYLKDEEGYETDIIAHLRPTSPLRTIEMLEKGINLLVDNPSADSVRAVCEPSQNPYKMWTIKNNGYLKELLLLDIDEPYNQPRQKLPNVYWQNGYVDITRSKTILENKSMTGSRILPLLVDSQHLIDIDNEITLKIAEMIFQQKNTNL